MKGSTAKRGETWTAYWSATDPGTGRRRQHSKGGFRLQRDARNHLNSILGDVGAGTWRADSVLTVRQLLVEHWLPAKQAEELRPSTASMYRRSIDGWVVPHIGGVEVRALTPSVVRKLTEKLRKAGLSPRSVQMAVVNLKAATAWAARNDLLARDPLAGYKRPKVTSPPMKSWNEAQARAFMASVADDRMGFAWALLLTRGLRRGEMCGIRWDAVDLEAGTVAIDSTRIVVDGVPADSRPKTERSRRSIPLDAALVSMLEKHRAVQSAEELAAGDVYRFGGWLVADEVGRPYSPDSVSGMFDKRVAASGLPRIRLHDCRHTAATLMLAKKEPVNVVAGMLGDDPATVLRVYAHVVAGTAEAAGAALSASLLG